MLPRLFDIFSPDDIHQPWTKSDFGISTPIAFSIIGQ